MPIFFDIVGFMWLHSRDVRSARLQRKGPGWVRGRRLQEVREEEAGLFYFLFFTCFENFFFLLTLKEWAVTVFALTCEGQGVPSAWWSSGAFSLADGEAMHSGPSRTTSRGFQLHKHPWVDSFSKVVLLAIRCSYSPDMKLSIVYLPWMLTCASEKDLAGEGTGLQDPFKE